MSSSIRSFDVFDTALVRLVGHPTSLFLLVGTVLARTGRLNLSAEQFAALRVKSEADARRATSAEEVTLDLIYRQMAFGLGLSPDEVGRFIPVEIELEQALLRAVPETQESIRRARKMGQRIVFVSDTYFPPETINGWLEHFEVATSQDRLFASSARGKTKASGNLYRIVMEEEKLQPREIVHTGDHTVSDVAVPKSLGIQAQHFPGCSLSAFERMMEEGAAATAGISSLFAGASRWLRLSGGVTDEDGAARRDLVAEVAGPVICAFVLWVLHRAKAHGLKRLLFVARDGQIMLKVARILAPKIGVDVEMSYIFAGRQVVNLAGLKTVDDRAIDWIVETAEILTIDDILERVDLKQSDVAAELENHGLPSSGLIGAANVEALRRFVADPKVTARILRAGAQRREELRGYLASCGLMDGYRCGVVDIGWRGRVLQAISEIIGGEHALQHVGLYFGLFGKPNAAIARNMETFLFQIDDDGTRGTGHDIPSLAYTMEIFCQGDHGKVLSVRKNGNGYAPVLRSPETMCGPTWRVPQFQNLVEDYARTLAVDAAYYSFVDLRGMCDRLLRRLLRRPTLQQARVLGGFHYNDDQGGAVAQPFAAAYRLSDAWSTLRAGNFPKKSHVWWEYGALALTRPWLRKTLRLVCLIGRARLNSFGASRFDQRPVRGNATSIAGQESIRPPARG